MTEPEEPDELDELDEPPPPQPYNTNRTIEPKINRFMVPPNESSSEKPTSQRLDVEYCDIVKTLTIRENPRIWGSVKNLSIKDDAKNQPGWSDDLAHRENVEARFLRGNAARSGELLRITAGAQQGGVSATPLIGNRGVPVLVFLPMRPQHSRAPSGLW